MTCLRTWWLALVVAVIISVAGVQTAGAKTRDHSLRITTIPAVPNFPVVVDGRTVLTDNTGVAHFETSNRQSLDERVTLKRANLKIGGKPARVVASRLYGKSGDHPHLAVDVYWPVQFSYLDIRGGSVNVNKIKSVRLKSSTGEIRRVDAREPVWLQGSRVVPLHGGLENKLLYWTVQEVDYASTNVVNASQQRFQPAEIQAVPLQLLFYRTEVSVRDGFFGFGTGKSVLLTYPDGSVSTFTLDRTHNVTLPSLPRGNYTVVVNGPGPLMSRPVAISRDQVLDLKFYSWLDIAVIVAIGAIFALGTLWLGWRRRIAYRGLRRAYGKLLGGTAEDAGQAVPVKRRSEMRPLALPGRQNASIQLPSATDQAWTWWPEGYATPQMTEGRRWPAVRRRLGNWRILGSALGKRRSMDDGRHRQPGEGPSWSWWSHETTSAAFVREQPGTRAPGGKR